MPAFSPVRNKMLFVAVSIAFAFAACYKIFLPVFMYNPAINAIIVSCFFIGLIFPVTNTRLLNTDKDFLAAFVSNANVPSDETSLLHKFLTGQRGEFRPFFSADESQTVLASVERRLSARHAILRYLVGLLILLGLLGTFLGLTQTVGSISKTMNSLAVGSFDEGSFNRLVDGIRSPLSGMGVAFSSSIFGLVGSLILGLLDLVQSKGEKEFFDSLENELFQRTKLYELNSSTQNSSNGPAYVWALLEQTVEVINAVSDKMKRTEENRFSVVNMMQEITNELGKNSFDKENFLSECREMVLGLHKTLEKIHVSIDEAVGRLDASREISGLKSVQSKVLEELIEGRKQMVLELKSEIRMIVKTLSILSDEPMSA
jgi:biopolymer transport protein ExbB/TolQ